MPTRKTEDWRYSSRKIKSPSEDSAPLELIKTNIIPLKNEDEEWLDKADPQSNQIHIKMIDGEFVAESSQSSDEALAEKITVLSFAELSDEQAQQVIQSKLNDIEGLPFATLNAAHFDDGLYVRVSADAPANTQIHIHHHCRDQQITAPRIYIYLDENAEACLIETYTADVCESEDNRLVTAVVDIILNPGAKLHNIRHNFETETVSHVGLTYVQALANSRFNSYCTGFGGQLRRHDLKVKLLEAGADCLLNGVTVTQNRQHYDNHTEIEHIAPNCNSEENYRCIAADNSHIVFNGRIHIHPHAQKTTGAMSNKNLLLSSSAEIDTKPELEIYADDVKCAHGATVGELDKEELYYLLTRGIDREEAATLLTMAFVMELVKQIPDSQQQDIVEERLTTFIQNVFAKPKEDA